MSSQLTVRTDLWSSNLGFLAAAIGSAVGLGNIWRFPYVAGENGGGTFLIPYLTAILLCGVPLMVFEIAAGRQYRRGILGTLQIIRPGAWVIGAGIALIGLVLVSYYLVITGWTLNYLIITPLGLDPSFSAFGNSWKPLVFFLLATGVCVLVVTLGVSRGIERASKLLLPILVAIVTLLAFYSLTFSGRTEALAFLFQPQFLLLLDPQVWAAGFGQGFFSLGVGMGVLITYGSYLDERNDVLRSAVVVTGADTIVALLAGLAIFPIVFTFGYSPGEGPQLAFETLPLIFEQMRFGFLLGTAFYLLLFLAAVTSAVSLLEMAVKAVSDKLDWRRARSVATIVMPLVALGSLSALSYSPLGLSLLGKPVLDTLDASVGTFGLLVGGLFTSIALFWLGNPQALLDQLGHSRRRVLRWGFNLGRYVLPTALICTLIATVIALVS